MECLTGRGYLKQRTMLERLVVASRRFKKIVISFRQGLAQVSFPNVCICCGHETVKREQYICSFCINDHFEDGNPENTTSSSRILLPDKVTLQHALWNFDKGGDLQKLLHGLKYDRLTSIGLQLGKALARRAVKHPMIQQQLGEVKPLLVPVPLHYLKFRKRGFNQAFTIARGIETITGISICEIDTVQRKKYTLSQTGFTLEKRLKNIENAFRVAKPERIKGKTVIIVDDVFTTGSTAFELSRTLKEADTASIMIWTVAQA